jgi:molybdenum cofactor synthesis domain-containing protein
MSKTAGIVVIGNEILSGKTRDENSPYLVRELRELGVDVRKISVIPDELVLISNEVREFSNANDYVFTTGGVGPTHDDLTMDGIAGAFGRSIRRHPDLEAILRHYYAQDLVEAYLRMADIPEGARLVGSQGLWFPVIAVENVFIFPGVPEILRRKFDRIKEMFREAPFHLCEVYLRADEGRISVLRQPRVFDQADARVEGCPVPGTRSRAIGRRTCKHSAHSGAERLATKRHKRHKKERLFVCLLCLFVANLL